MVLPREPKSTDPIYVSTLRYAIRGLRFDRTLSVGWQLDPSIGLVAKDVNRLGIDIRSFKEPLSRSVKTVIIPSIRKNFQMGGRPPWEPLAEYTIKMRGYSAWPILERSGTLKKAATQFNIWSIGETSAAVRSLPQKAWYGAVHQAGYGTEYGAGTWFEKYQKAARKMLGSKASVKDVDEAAWKIFDTRVLKHGGAPRVVSNIPQRQFIMFQEQDIEDIQLVFYEWLAERAAAVGRFVPDAGTPIYRRR